MGQVILEMQGITKRFPGVVALDATSLSICAGEIHAVVGENGAGKSTLMKCLIGLYAADAGTIKLDGKRVSFKGPREALAHGISMIHQEMSLVPTMTVSENIWLGQEDKFSICGVLNVAARTAATQALLETWDIQLEPQALIEQLSVAEMQLVELLRALSYQARIIIMDEPTSALTKTEIDRLFAIIRRLTHTQNVSIVFISHKLNEIFEICDRISVYRDGRYIETAETNAMTMDRLIHSIAGREMSDMFPKEKADIGEVVLSVENFSRAGVFESINFELRRGEILGFCGLMGAGRTEIMRALFGIDRPSGGTVRVRGKAVHIKSPSDAVAQGFGMVTEDRLRMGSIHGISIVANTTLAYFKRLCNRLGLYSPKREMSIFYDVAKRLTVKYSSPREPMRQLSGGNQQKVILGRWLLTEPDILILDEPTRGIDVGAKAEIHRLISRLAGEGKAIILVSSELPEILGMSDRIIVIREGRQVYECLREDAEQETLMARAFGADSQAVNQ